MSDYSRFKFLKVSIDSRIALVRLNRGPYNGFITPLAFEIQDCFGQLDQDDDVHVVIITGNDKFFCAGADLESRNGSSPFAGESGSPLGHRDGGGIASLAIYKCRKVVIGAINGPAIGVGITMTLPMDFRITHKANKIGFVFAQRGIVTEACSSFFLPKLVGYTNAIALVGSAKVLPAEHRWANSLFSTIVDSSNQVLPEAMSLAKDIVQHNSVVSHGINKNLLWSSRTEPFEQHLMESMAVYLSSNNDGQEGVKSFLEKRKPKFTGKLTSKDADGFITKIRARL